MLANLKPYQGLMVKVAIFILLSLTYFLVNKPKEDKTLKTKEPSFLIAPETALGQIDIQKGNSVFLLFNVNKEGVWQLNATSLPVAEERIKALVTTLLHLEIEQTITTTSYADYGLNSPVFTFNLTTQQNQPLVLYLGNVTPNQKSVYVKLENNPNIYVLNLEQLEPFIDNETFYLDGSIDKINFNALQSLTLVNSQGTLTLEPAITNNPFFTYQFKQPYSGLSVDNQIFTQLLTQWQRQFHFYKDEMIPNPLSLKPYGLDKPKASITFTDTTAKTLSLNIGNQALQDVSYYAQVVGDNVVFQLDSQLAEQAINLNAFSLLNKFVSLQAVDQVESFSFIGPTVNQQWQADTNLNLYEQLLMLFYDTPRETPLPTTSLTKYQTIFNFKDGTQRTVNFLTYNNTMLAVSINNQLTPFLIANSQLQALQNKLIKE